MNLFIVGAIQRAAARIENKLPLTFMLLSIYIQTSSWHIYHSSSPSQQPDVSTELNFSEAIGLAVAAD